MINYEESVENFRLVYQSDLLNRIINFIMYTMLLMLIPFMAWIKMTDPYAIYQGKFLNMTLIILSIIWIYLVLTWVRRSNELQMIDGKSKDENRERIIAYFKDHKLNLFEEAPQYIIGYTNNKLFAADRRASILFYRNKILINVTTYGMVGIKSPLHWFKDRKTEKRLIEDFRKLIFSN